jgi:hypothetical protein
VPSKPPSRCLARPPAALSPLMLPCAVRGRRSLTLRVSTRVRSEPLRLVQCVPAGAMDEALRGKEAPATVCFPNDLIMMSRWMLCEAQENSAITDAAGRGAYSVCAMRCAKHQWKTGGRNLAFSYKRLFEACISTTVEASSPSTTERCRRRY